MSLVHWVQLKPTNIEHHCSSAAIFYQPSFFCLVSELVLLQGLKRPGEIISNITSEKTTLACNDDELNNIYLTYSGRKEEPRRWFSCIRNAI